MSDHHYHHRRRHHHRHHLIIAVVFNFFKSRETSTDSRSLVDLLVLHLNGELDASYEDEPKAVDEALVPAYLGSVFRNARKYKDGKINGQKRDRSGFVRMGLEAKKLVKESFKYKLLKAGSSESECIAGAWCHVISLTSRREGQA